MPQQIAAAKEAAATLTLHTTINLFLIQLKSSFSNCKITAKCVVFEAADSHLPAPNSSVQLSAVQCGIFSR